MSCTETTCAIPVRLPGADTTQRGNLADLRANAMRRARPPVILRGAIALTPSISAPEGTSCGCEIPCGGGGGCAGGCGPSCGCGPCRARWGGAVEVIDATPINSIGMDPITAQMVGYPRGFNTMVEGRNLAAERAMGDAPPPDVATVAPSAKPWNIGATAIIARGAMAPRTTPTKGYYGPQQPTEPAHGDARASQVGNIYGGPPSPNASQPHNPNQIVGGPTQVGNIYGGPPSPNASQPHNPNQIVGGPTQVGNIYGGPPSPNASQPQPWTGMDDCVAACSAQAQAYNAQLDAARRQEEVERQRSAQAYNAKYASTVAPPGAVKMMLARGAMSQNATGGQPGGVYPAEGGLSPAAVADIQRKLTLLGFTGDCGYTNRPLVADGMIGPSTRLAVRGFQKAQGLAVDGVLWPQTQAAIQRAWGDRHTSDTDIVAAYNDLYHRQSLAAFQAAALAPAGDARPPWAMSYSASQWAALGPGAREAARVMHAARGGAVSPSGAVGSPVRAVPWDMLTPEERQTLLNAAVSRMGVAPSGVAVPTWAASTYSQQEWDALGAERRAALEAQNREAQPGAGWGLANSLITAGTNIFNTVMSNDTQRELARLREQSAQGNAEAQRELQRFMQESNNRIAELTAEAARARSSGGDPAQLQMLADALRGMQSGNNGQVEALREELRRSQQAQSGNTTMMVGLAAAAGLGALLLLRKK